MKYILSIMTVLTVFILSACVPTVYTFTLAPGNDTVEINTSWEDPGAYLEFNTTKVDYDTKTGSVDTTTLGLYEVTYLITYKETDYSITRYVYVVDQTAPELILNPGIDSLQVGDSSWVDAGVSVTDNSGETITTTSSGTVDYNTPGTYTITYTATDSSGNTSTLERVVTVFND